VNKGKEKIVSLNRSELKKSLTAARLKLAQLRLDWQAGKLNRRSEIIKERREIALLLTLIRQKELKGEEK